MTIASEVLEIARFAPSGDNSQPWRFVLRSASDVDVYGYDTREHCVYDLDGWASELSHGALLETIAIAATQVGARASIELPTDAGRPRRYVVRLAADASVRPDPLANVIIRRTVQRRSMRPRPLASEIRAELERAARPFRISWFESARARKRIAAINAGNARIRLTIPEAYAVHREVIQWNATTSVDRMPDASLGANFILLAIMRRAMSNWRRLDAMNRIAGTWLPQLALDFIPGLFCSAHVALVANRMPKTLADRIAAGRAVQRMWLTATLLGLQIQPQYTPLVFARYAREGRRFSRMDRAQRDAERIRARLASVLGSDDADQAVWLARIGPERSVPGRSLRLPLDVLTVAEPPSELPRLTA
jgi:nitroreductase